MTIAAQTSTFEYDPYSAEAMRNPQLFYPTLRDQHPAYFLPDYDSYVFTRYADVWDGFMDSEHFSEAEGQVFSRDQLLVHHRGNPPQPKLDEPKAMFLFTDPPVHTRFRQALAAPFLKGSIGKLAPQLTELVRARIAELKPLGRFDLNHDLGSFVSVAATAVVMGIPVSDSWKIVELVNRMVARAPGKPGPTPDGLVAREEIVDFLAEAVARRRRGEGSPSAVIDPLIHKDLLGRPLTDKEVAVDLLAILVGGTETVPKVFSGGLLELWKRPRQLEEVRADVAANSIPAFEEMLRYCAPAQWFGRTVKKPHTLGGVSLEVGQRVLLVIAAANRDPREFDNPDEFIWNRKAKRMLSFGVGPHFCIGIHLARLEGQIMLRELLASVGDFTIEPEAGNWATSEFQIGWTRLPIRLG